MERFPAERPRLTRPPRCPTDAAMHVYKILTEEEVLALRRDGAFAGAPVDLEDGFIHLSAGHQVADTAEKHFAGQQGLWILAMDAEALGDDLKWEAARGANRFPHLYREIRLADVLWVRPLQQGPDGRFRFSEEVGP